MVTHGDAKALFDVHPVLALVVQRVARSATHKAALEIMEPKLQGFIVVMD
jgi:hypothetical protein